MVPRGAHEDDLSQHSDMQLRGSNVEDSEEPPPPYPGNAELTTSRNVPSTEHMWHSSLRPARQSTRAPANDSTGENGPLSTEERGLGAPSSEGHHVVGPCGNHVVNAWIDSEEVDHISGRETSNEPCRTTCWQSNVERRNSDINQRDPNLCGMFVTHCSQGRTGAVSTTQTLSSVNAELSAIV